MLGLSFFGTMNGRMKQPMTAISQAIFVGASNKFRFLCTQSSPRGGQNLELFIGNSYRRLPENEASLDRSGSHLKIHDWTLFVDVKVPSHGSAPLENAIKKVTFDLGPTFLGKLFTCWSPIPIITFDGSPVWRFSTRQTSYGKVKAKIRVQGAGGKVQDFSHALSFSDSYQGSTLIFSETTPPQPPQMIPMPKKQKFGIELECSAINDDAAACIEEALPSSWKLVHDSSITCPPSTPDCFSFEIVSPPLKGGAGLKEVNKVCKVLEKFKNELLINKSMGFHVHIDVGGRSTQELKKICQQFIKYEDVFDTLMPPSRRTGSAESNRYFQSNRESVGRNMTNKQRIEALANCQDLPSLAELMNAEDSRYFKLNLQNLRTGRQPTLEFRQHSATVEYPKIAAWVRLCTRFCGSSARFVEPAPFHASRTPSERLRYLFWYVIKDRALRDFYLKRQQEVEG